MQSFLKEKTFLEFLFHIFVFLHFAFWDSSGKLVDGVKQLDDGAKQLEEGMNKFKQEAIDKIMHVYKDDIKVLFDRLSAVANASGEYNNFSGIADGTQGEVKFIFETEGISKKDK